MPTQRINSLDAGKLQNIVAAALEEFSEHPYDSASFNQIIKKSGISKGSMYYYFESKEDLFLALLTRTFDKLVPLAKAYPCFDHPEPFWNEGRRQLTWLFDFFERQPRMGKFVQMVLAQPGKGKDTPAACLLSRIDDALKDFIAMGQVAGAVRRDLPLEVLAGLVWSAWHSMLGWLNQGDKIRPSIKADTMVDLLSRLLTP